MRRKVQPRTERVAPPEMLERARQSVSEDRLKTPGKCPVCGGETSPMADGEALCWVCRRLKISAWRDVEQQAPAQE